MNNSDLVQILESEKAWLAEQPGMQPWDAGCRQLVALLEDCCQQYSAMVREAVIPADDVDRPLVLVRLWQCLGYHWKTALEPPEPADPSPSQTEPPSTPEAGDTASPEARPEPDRRLEAGDVAKHIAAGRGYRRGGKLGGDPLRDVVLAVAMTRNDGRAASVFQEDYFRLARALAARLNGRLAADPLPWWNELLDYLAGYTRPKAKLDRFRGRCALKNWLPLVIVRFLYRWRFDDSNEGPEPDELAGQSALPGESLRLFAEIVCAALDQLAAEDRLLLALIYVDRSQNKHVAEVLGISAGAASRRHDRVLARLQPKLLQEGRKRLSEAAFTALLEDLRNNSRLFGAILREALDRLPRPSRVDDSITQAAGPDARQGGQTP